MVIAKDPTTAPNKKFMTDSLNCPDKVPPSQWQGSTQWQGRIHGESSKEAKKLVVGNTMSNCSLNTNRCMRACLLYRNRVLNPDTCRTIAQTLMGQHLRDALPALNFTRSRKNL